MNAVTTYATAFLTTAGMLAFLRALAERIGLLDHPNARKAHARPVPLIGGMAMFCGFALAALTLEIGLPAYRSFFAAAAILVVVGILDDLRELSSPARFAAQIAAALLMANWGGVILADVGLLRPDDTVFVLGSWEMAFTVFATVGVINALNMADGLDGLAGGLGLIAMGGLALIANAAGYGDDRELLILLCVVVVAFLLFNVRLPGRPHALVFMGDAGSMFLGFAITWFFISMSQGEARAMAPVTALWLLLLPLYDTVWLLVWRPLTGRSPFAPGVEHLHHVLQMAGLGANQTLGLMLAIALGSAWAGIAAERAGVPERLMFYLFLGLFACYCVVMALTWRTNRFLFWAIERRLGGEDRRADVERREADRRLGGDRRRRADRRDIERRAG